MPAGHILSRRLYKAIGNKVLFAEVCICSSPKNGDYQPKTAEALVNDLIENELYLNDLCTKSNEELVELARSDRDAAAVIISRFYRLVSVKAGLYSNSAAESDDLRQEGLLSLFSAIGAFDSKKGVKFATFAEVCIENKMRTIVKSSMKKITKAEDIDALSEAEKLAAKETPESIYLYKEFVSELWESIVNELSRAELSAIRLHMQGLNYAAAAEKLGVSAKSVDNAVQRARKKIREMIRRSNMTV